MALGNNGIDSLNVLTAALNSISGPEYASYNYKIMKEYKENGIKAIKSNVTDPIAYNAGKVITDAVLVAVGVTGAVGSVSLITAGLTGEVASAAAEIFSFGTATPAVACTVAVSTAAVAVGAAGVEASLVLAVNAGKNGIDDAVDLINAIKSGNGASKAGSTDDFILNVENGKGLYASIDSNGKVAYVIEAGPESPMRGSEMFDKMMEHFGDNVKSIEGNWTYGDNLGTFNKLTANGVSIEQAAIDTFTGKQAAKYGFTKVTVQSTTGVPGNYSKISVLFGK